MAAMLLIFIDCLLGMLTIFIDCLIGTDYVSGVLTLFIYYRCLIGKSMQNPTSVSWNQLKLSFAGASFNPCSSCTHWLCCCMFESFKQKLMKIMSVMCHSYIYPAVSKTHAMLIFSSLQYGFTMTRNCTMGKKSSNKFIANV